MRYTVLLVVLALSFAPTECGKLGFISRIANIFSKKVLKHVPKEEVVVQQKPTMLLGPDMEPVTDDHRKVVSNTVMQRFREQVKEQMKLVTGLQDIDDASVDKLVEYVVEEHSKAQLKIARKMQKIESEYWVVLEDDDTPNETALRNTVTMLFDGLHFVQMSGSRAVKSAELQQAAEKINAVCVQQLNHLIEYAKKSALRHLLQMAVALSPELDKFLKQPMSVSSEAAWTIVNNIAMQCEAEVQAEGTKVFQNQAPVIIKIILRAVASYYAPVLMPFI